jgi:serine/threonine protein kinase
LGDFGSCTNKFDLKETVGNQWFMAPETFVSGVFTEASAVYSISMVMYFILNNLRPAFWTQDCEDEALQKRMNGHNLPTPAGCINLPSHIKTKFDKFFNKVSASLPKERVSRVAEFIYELERLTFYCEDSDYIIHRKGFSLDFDLDAGNNARLDARWHYISRDAYHRYAMGDEVELMCTTDCFELDKCIPNDEIISVDIVEDFAITAGYNDYDSDNNISFCGSKLNVDEVENFARTMASDPGTPSSISPYTNITDEVKSYSSTVESSKNKRATYNATVQKSKKSIWRK